MPSNPPFYRWFAGAELNTCHNALDRHVERGRAEQTALIYDSPVTNSKKSFTYRALRDQVAKLAGAIAAAGRRQGRPRHHLHADDPRGGDGDAGLRAAGRGAFGGVRRLCRQRARHPHRRLHAQAGADGVVRRRAGPDRAVQAVARPGDRARRAQDRALPRVPAPAGHRDDGEGPRPRLERGGGGGPAARLRAGEGHRSALHSLHVGHDRPAQGRGARQWRLLRGARLVDAISLRHQSGRGLVVRLGRGLGGRPQLHRLRPADPRRDLDPLRGQAGRHARRRRLLARDLRAQGRRAVHRADRLPRHQEGGSRGQAPEAVRPLEVPHPVPGRRARRSADHRMGAEASRRADRRSLVADRDRLGDLRQLRRPRADADQARLVLGAVAGLASRSAGRAGQGHGEAGRGRGARRQAAAAARQLPDPVERRRALPAGLSRGVSRLLQDRRRGLHRCQTATSR